MRNSVEPEKPSATAWPPVRLYEACERGTATKALNRRTTHKVKMQKAMTYESNKKPCVPPPSWQ